MSDILSGGPSRFSLLNPNLDAMWRRALAQAGDANTPPGGGAPGYDLAGSQSVPPSDAGDGGYNLIGSARSGSAPPLNLLTADPSSFTQPAGDQSLGQIGSGAGAITADALPPPNGYQAGPSGTRLSTPMVGAAGIGDNSSTMYGVSPAPKNQVADSVGNLLAGIFSDPVGDRLRADAGLEQLRLRNAQAAQAAQAHIGATLDDFSKNSSINPDLIRLARALPPDQGMALLQDAVLGTAKLGAKEPEFIDVTDNSTGQTFSTSKIGADHLLAAGGPGRYTVSGIAPERKEGDLDHAIAQRAALAKANPTDPAIPIWDAQIKRLTTDPSMANKDVDRARIIAETNSANAKTDQLANGMMDDDTVQFRAEQALAGDPAALANLGRGTQGGVNLTKISNRVQQLAQQRGISGSQLAGLNANFSAVKSGMITASKRSAQMDATMNEVNSFADQALQASQAVSRGQFVPLNQLENFARSNTSDPNYGRLSVALQSLKTAYAQAMSRTGAPTDLSRRHADDIIDPARSHGDLQARIDQIKQETAAALKATQDTGATLQSRIGGGGIGQPAPDASANTPLIRWGRDANGRPVRVGGQ